MIVSREELEQCIADLREEITSVAGGIYGPGSMSWKVDGEVSVFLAGGRAALLQLAHPFVAHAVDQHSDTRNDPLGRFQRTFKHVGAMAFGDFDHAVSSARRVHAIHQRIYGSADDGTEYQANDANALLWVWATLVDSAVLAYESVVGHLSDDDRDAYLRESRRFARLFGIPSALLPTSWSAFAAYMTDMYPRLRVTEPARDMAGFLLEAPKLWLPMAARWYRILPIGFLPPVVREGFHFRFGRGSAVTFRASLQSLRIMYRGLPRRVRQIPDLTRAQRRLAGVAGDDQVAAWMERVLFDPTSFRRSR